MERDQRRTKSRGKELPLASVDLLNCHDFMWLKWKRELGSVYSTINLSFKPKDLATLKLLRSTHKTEANAVFKSDEIFIDSF